MSTPPARPSPRPAKDEWGVYDPQQAGLAALFARVDSRDALAVSNRPTKNGPDAAPRPPLRDTE
jgi:hypothetical protein